MAWYVWLGVAFFTLAGLGVWADARRFREPGFRVAGFISLAAAGAMVWSETLWPVLCPGLWSIRMAGALQKRCRDEMVRRFGLGLPPVRDAWDDFEALDYQLKARGYWSEAEGARLTRLFREGLEARDRWEKLKVSLPSKIGQRARVTPDS